MRKPIITIIGTIISLGVYESVSAETVTSTFGNEVGIPNNNAGGAITTNMYSDAIAAGTYSPGSGYFDATEPIYQVGGAEPIPDDTGLIFYMNGIPVTNPMNAALGHEEANFTFMGLTPNHPFSVTVTASDFDDFGLTWDPDGLDPALETLAVFANGEEIGLVESVAGNGLDQLITTTLSIDAVSDANGRLELGFNFPFLWYPGEPAPPYGDTNGARIEQISISSAVTFRVDSAPNIYGSPDWAPWWAQAISDVADANFENMRSATYPNTFYCDPYDEIVYSTGDGGRRVHWIYRIDNETVFDLSGRFEVKWVIDWGGTHYTYANGGWADDGPEVGWSEPSSWEDNNGGVTGSLGFAWWSTDNDAYPYDTDGNPYNETDQADIDALRDNVFSAQTYLRGMVRYKDTIYSDWETTSIELDIVGSMPGDVNGDNRVDLHDILEFFVQWGPCSGCSADFDNDGVVGVSDLMVIVENWGNGTSRSLTPRMPRFHLSKQH